MLTKFIKVNCFPGAVAAGRGVIISQLASSVPVNGKCIVFCFNFQ